MVKNRKSQKMTDWEIKQEAVRTWSSDPCGAIYIKHPMGSKAFFDAYRNFRYSQGVPWISEIVNFNKYRDRKVLEIGCGVGTDLGSFAKAGAVVTGIDLTHRSVELATKQFEVYGLKGKFLVADAENLPFPDEKFDTVYSFGVLHHTPNIQKAIHEIHRVIKPEGEAMIMLYNKNSIFFWWDIVFIEGILHMNLFRESIRDRLSRIEYTISGAKPLVRVYTKRHVKRFFYKFREVNIRIFRLNKDDIWIPFIGNFTKRLIPDKIVCLMSRLWGWDLFIQAIR